MAGRLFAPVGFDFTLSALFFHFQDWPATFLLVLSVDDFAVGRCMRARTEPGACPHGKHVAVWHIPNLSIANSDIPPLLESGCSLLSFTLADQFGFPPKCGQNVSSLSRRMFGAKDPEPPTILSSL